MDRIKVTVIIPVYNTAKYIQSTLLSIINQTLKEIEIIVVNDGSTDNSLELINELGEKDNRVHIYTQENKGQAIARNRGLSAAIGEYIYLMDSDDLLENNTLEICYNRCISEKLDFVFFDAENFCEDGDISFSTDYDRQDKVDELVYDGVDLLNQLLKIGEYRVPPWLYFINNDFLKSTKLEFLPNLLHEDQIFTPKLFIEAQRVSYISQKFFKRRLRPNSIMTSKYSMCNMNTYYVVLSDLKQFAKGKDHNVKSAIDKIMRNIINSALFAARDFPIKERIAILRKCRAEYIEYIDFKTKLKFMIPSGAKRKVMLNMTSANKRKTI